MKQVLEGTVALVTGASSGIGAATAAALAAQGAAVALAARRRDRLEVLAAGIRDQGGTALVLESDITDEQQATDAVARTVAELGRLDTLINNAGVMLLGPAAGAPLPEWQQMVELLDAGGAVRDRSSPEAELVAVGISVDRLTDAVLVGLECLRVDTAGCRRLHEAVEVTEEHGDHRVTGVFGPELDVDRPVLGQGPYPVGIVRLEGRGPPEETLEPGDGTAEVAHRDTGKQIHFHRIAPPGIQTARAPGFHRAAIRKLSAALPRACAHASPRAGRRGRAW